MKIDKAIELLHIDINDPGSVDIMDLNKAQQLGIEALKYLQHLREGGWPGIISKLPGETEE